MRVPHNLLDILCVVMEDTGTLILLPLFYHWRGGGREKHPLIMTATLAEVNIVEGEIVQFFHDKLREFSTYKGHVVLHNMNVKNTLPCCGKISI